MLAQVEGIMQNTSEEKNGSKLEKSLLFLVPDYYFLYFCFSAVFILEIFSNI